MTVRPQPGYHLHWFNDDGVRINYARREGFTHIVENGGDAVRRMVGTGRGGALYAYAMECPAEGWLERVQRVTPGFGPI